MKPGERQVSPTRDGIRRDHVARYEWAAQLLLHHRAPSGPAHVIDAGCGIGYGGHLLAEAGHAVKAFDADAEAIEYARQHYAHERIEYMRIAAAEFSGEAITADAAICFEVIEHLHDPASLLRELRHAATSLLVSVPNEDVLPYQNHAYHYRHYTSGEFQTLLESTGWEVVEWYGQKDVESDVEKNCNGRTLIAVCRHRGEKSAAPEAPRIVDLTAGLDRAVPNPVPEHVAILGLGPSVVKYLEFVKRLGGRHKFCDEVWAINAIGDVVNCDRIFHMDDVRIQEIRAKAAPQSNIAAMLHWLRRHPGPIYTSRSHPDYPGLVDFPLEDVVNSTKYAYFNSTAAYAVAFAVHIGVRKMTLFGMDFTYPNVHQAEKGRACVEFWMGMAAARGIELSIPHVSSLMDGCTPEDRLYGYDTVNVSLEKIDGRIQAVFTERESLPAAEEIEKRYDHTVHPNPLVEER